MKKLSILARAAACLLLATAGVHAHAQQAAQAAAADPQAAVPATTYHSLLPADPAPAAPAAGGSPDRNWVANNQKAAATNSMALTMKGMHGMPGMDMARHPQAPAPAASTPATGAHAHHHQETQ